MLINEATKGGSVIVELALGALIILGVGTAVFAMQHTAVSQQRVVAQPSAEVAQR